MKTFRTTRGPFAERPFFSDAEVERMCLDALNEVGLLPQTPTAIRIDRFIETKFKVGVSYEDLPQGLLGFTTFDGGRVASVVVAKSLDNETTATAERRIRTTLAHEGGHGLFHAYLFALAPGTKPLFGDVSDPDKPKVLCRGEGASATQYRGEWWEYQANKAIGALLMPRPLVDRAVERYLATSPLGLQNFDHARAEEAARDLAEIFEVNPVVARIRIGQLYPKAEGQLLL
ncbi:MAG: hypothetical protein ABFD89_29770 [Bryobacteraceae bacterium]